ncbi:restriction endonuclease [Bosea sp. LjRoot237]|uniref:restriction endonuclease n=1 Tax=Bosea sp. LjRoot237 TaxID=3342292 RepID=UPI003ECF7F78
MPPTTTRTIGPLHFEDLEPHRFEDLVRQLLYDFRPWAQLEATGRGGGDDGFDVRAWESITVDAGDDDRADEADFESGAADLSRTAQRQWLVQCKRERQIAPKKLSGYLAEVAKHEDLHGLVFAAACDFSKLARDLFRSKAAEMGLSEAYLWGKAEIEDLLFQPKNDHLLFAYFGFSLQLRKRALRTAIRSKLAAKRKVIRAMKDRPNLLLIRSASDDRYPYLDEDESKTRSERGRWEVFRYLGCKHDGVHLEVGRHLAFLDDDGERWDYAATSNDAVLSEHEDPWSEGGNRADARGEAWKLWMALPPTNQAWYEVAVVLPYEAIVDVDIDGDDCCKHPHVIAEGATPDAKLVRPGFWHKLKTTGFDARRVFPMKEHRVEVFPREIGPPGAAEQMAISDD